MVGKFRPIGSGMARDALIYCFVCFVKLMFMSFSPQFRVCPLCCNV